jgi:hypothetical protein
MPPHSLAMAHASTLGVLLRLAGRRRPSHQLSTSPQVSFDVDATPISRGCPVAVHRAPM